MRKVFLLAFFFVGTVQAEEEEILKIKPADVAIFGDFRADLKADDPDFKKWAKRVDGKVLKIPGVMYDVVSDTDVPWLVTWKNPQTGRVHQVKFHAIPHRDPKVMEWIGRARDVVKDPNQNATKVIKGTVTGKVYYNESKRQFDLEGAVFEVVVVKK